MEKLLKSLLMLFILVLIKSYQTQVFSRSKAQGCSFESRSDMWTCDFMQWKPPLTDASFRKDPYMLTVENIDGRLPAGAFSGLNGPSKDSDTVIILNCVSGGTTVLSRDIFTENLHWVKSLSVLDCYLENGLSPQLLENLKSLTSLSIAGDGIGELISHDALYGLAYLRVIQIKSPVKTGSLPQGFFHGLKNLSSIYLHDSELNFIPSNWFKGLISLRWILLSRNNLHTLLPGLFDELPSLAQVWLGGNQWDCSCSLRWLLDWSHVTVGGSVCQNPLAMQGKELDEGLRQLDCTASTLMSLSAAHLDTKNTETGTSPADTTQVTAVPATDMSISPRYSRMTIASALGLTVSSIATSPQKDLLASKSASTFVKHMESTRCMTIRTISTPISATKLSATTIPTVTERTASWTASKTRTRKLLLEKSSLTSAKSTIAQAVFSASITSKEPVSYNRETSYGETGNDLNKLIFISSICAALPVLVLVTVVLYRYMYCYMNNGRVNQVNSGEESSNRTIVSSRHRPRRPTNVRRLAW